MLYAWGAHAKAMNDVGDFSSPLVITITDKPACLATQSTWVLDSYSVLGQRTGEIGTIYEWRISL